MKRSALVLRIVSALFIGLALLLSTVGTRPALAQATTFTQTFQDMVIPIFDPTNPCNPAIGTGVVNGVTHFTEAANGNLLVTTTFSGTFDVIDLNSGLNATGHFTFREGFTFKPGTPNREGDLFTLNVTGTREDGSKAGFKIILKLNFVDGVPTLDFFKAVCR